MKTMNKKLHIFGSLNAASIIAGFLFIMVGMVGINVSAAEPTRDSLVNSGVDVPKIANSQWPRWGHDNQNTFSNTSEKKISPTTVGSLVPLWSTDTGFDSAENSVVIADGLMYNELFSSIQVTDIKTGLNAAGFNGGVPLDFTPDALGSPIVLHGNYMYFTILTAGTDDVIMLSYNRFDGSLNPHWPVGGTLLPLMPDDLADRSQLYSITGLTIVDDGKDSMIFTAMTSNNEGAPGGTTAFPRVAGINLHTGVVMWSLLVEELSGAGGGSWSCPSFDIKHKLMFFGTANPQNPPAGPDSDALQARDYRTGRVVWNHQYNANDVSSGLYPNGVGNAIYTIDTDLGASPNVFDVAGMSLVGASGKTGEYRAVDRVSGKLVWKTNLNSTPTIWGNPSASYNKGVLYTATTSDVDPTASTPGHPVPYTTYAQAISGDFGATLASWQFSTGIVTALDARTGEIIWRDEFPSSIWAAPVYANGVVYVTSYDGTLRALDADNGNVLASYMSPPQDSLGGLLPANAAGYGVVVVDGVLYYYYFSFFNPTNGVLALAPTFKFKPGNQQPQTVRTDIRTFRNAVASLNASNAEALEGIVSKLSAHMKH
jgi:outer membrane protein assembly factor BamB